jgi:hypothetical protein
MSINPISGRIELPDHIIERILLSIPESSVQINKSLTGQVNDIRKRNRTTIYDTIEVTLKEIIKRRFLDTSKNHHLNHINFLLTGKDGKNLRVKLWSTDTRLDFKQAMFLSMTIEGSENKIQDATAVINVPIREERINITTTARIKLINVDKDIFDKFLKAALSKIYDIIRYFFMISDASDTSDTTSDTPLIMIYPDFTQETNLTALNSVLDVTLQTVKGKIIVQVMNESKNFVQKQSGGRRRKSPVKPAKPVKSKKTGQGIGSKSRSMRRAL